MEDVRCLLSSATEDAYKAQMEHFMKLWDVQFEQYYMKEIHPNIHLIGRWRLEELGIYNPYSGVTTNQSESFNRVLKGPLSRKPLVLNQVLCNQYKCLYFH